MNAFAQWRTLKLAAALVAALGMAACAKNAAEDGLMAGGGIGGAGMGGAGGAAVPGSQQEFANSVGDRVFFETDSTELTPTGQETLNKQAAWLTRYSRYTFTLEGHADERGTREYNFALGARRADTVKNYLVARGISPGRMKTISYGKERPVAVCDDISCWSQNRRVVTALGGGTS